MNLFEKNNNTEESQAIHCLYDRIAMLFFTCKKIEIFPITTDPFGSGKVKWSELQTPDGWTMVSNEDRSVGYSKSSGLKLIQVDGYASWTSVEIICWINLKNDYKNGEWIRKLELENYKYHHELYNHAVG